MEKTHKGESKKRESGERDWKKTVLRACVLTGEIQKKNADKSPSVPGIPGVVCVWENSQADKVDGRLPWWSSG